METAVELHGKENLTHSLQAYMYSDYIKGMNGYSKSGGETGFEINVLNKERFDVEFKNLSKDYCDFLMDRAQNIKEKKLFKNEVNSLSLSFYVNNVKVDTCKDSPVLLLLFK